jgi:hypothetical protein
MFQREWSKWQLLQVSQQPASTACLPPALATNQVTQRVKQNPGQDRRWSSNLFFSDCGRSHPATPKCLSSRGVTRCDSLHTSFKQNTEQIILRIRPQGSYIFCFHSAVFLRCAALKKGAGRREVVALKPNNKTNPDTSAKETSLDCQLFEQV